MTPILYHLGQFPPNKLDWQSLLPLIGQAREAVGRFDGILSAYLTKLKAFIEGEMGSE